MGDAAPKSKTKKRMPANFDGVPKKQAKTSVYTALNRHKELTVMTYLTMVYRLNMDMEDKTAFK